MKVPREWSEFIGSLSAARVRFLIVGAHALAIHGRPRATGDLDILIDPTTENARRVAEALRAFGYPELGRRARDFAVPERMATMGRPPFRIDVMTSISGVSFAQAWRGRIKVQFGDRIVGVIGREQFEANKRASGRPKDLLDLELLAEISGKGTRGATPRRRVAPSAAAKATPVKRKPPARRR